MVKSIFILKRLQSLTFYIPVLLCLVSRQTVSTLKQRTHWHLNLMMSFTESRAQATIASFLTLFIPVIRPRRRANRLGILTQGLARRRATRWCSLLLAQDPFIVPIPTMQGLIGTREAFITRSRTRTLDHVQASRFFLVEFRRFRRKDLLLY